MTAETPRPLPNPQERLIAAMRESAEPHFVPYTWLGFRTPDRIAILDPRDPERKKKLVDIPVGYMRDGMVFDRNSQPIGVYERIIDDEEQPDGSSLHAILLYPTNPTTFGEALIRKEK